MIMFRTCETKRPKKIQSMVGNWTEECLCYMRNEQQQHEHMDQNNQGPWNKCPNQQFNGNEIQLNDGMAMRSTRIMAQMQTNGVREKEKQNMHNHTMNKYQTSM